MPRRTADGRIPSLDGWRAAAIALVLLSHDWQASSSPINFGRWSSLFLQGDLGVRVFFVLSGFLITQLLLREHAATGAINLRNFYARRSLRIFPVYYLFLLCLAVLSLLGLHKESPSSWLGALTFTRNIVGRGASATIHLWSLAVEAQFYALWPAAVVWLGLSNRWRTALGILAAVIVVSFAARVPACGDFSFVCTRILGTQSAVKAADALAVGSLIAILDARGKIARLPSAANSLLLWTCVLALAISAFPFTYGTTLKDSAAHALQAWLIGGAIYASIYAHPTTFGYRLLNWKPVVSLGLWSYSLYIWHMLFLSGYMGAAFTGRALYDWRIWWIPALVLAMCSYYFFERPIASWRRRFRAPALQADRPPDDGVNSVTRPEPA